MPEAFSPMDEVELQQALVGLARFTRHYYVALIAEGFTADQALTLAVAWATTMQAGAQTMPTQDDDE